MAKIGKDGITIKGEFHALELHYSSKTGFSYKGLPDEFVKMMAWNERRYYKEDEMRNALITKVREYHERIAKSRKVIVIRLGGAAEMIYNKVARGHYSGHKPDVNKLFESFVNAPTYCFGFEYNIMLETDSNGVHYNYYTDLGGVGARSNSIFKDRLVIDWTPEREKFLEDLGEKVQQLVYGVSAFFSDPEALKLMDSHGVKPFYLIG